MHAHEHCRLHRRNLCPVWKKCSTTDSLPKFLMQLCISMLMFVPWGEERGGWGTHSCFAWLVYLCLEAHTCMYIAAIAYTCYVCWASYFSPPNASHSTAGMSCNLHIIDSDHAITGSPIILNIDLFLSFLLGVDIMLFIKDVNVRMHIVALALAPGPGPGPGLLLHKLFGRYI